MAAGSNKSQNFKKWVLVLFSLIAVVVWVRNVFILMPDSESAPLSSEIRAEATTHTAHATTNPSAFNDSAGWIDPFAPPMAKRGKGPPDSPVQAIPTPKPPSEPPPWTLAGIVWDKKSPTAILASVIDDRRIVVAKGDTLGLSRVERIEDGNVWVRHNGRTWKLALAGDSGDTR